MKYRESKKDKTLRKWFANDYSRLLLRRITLNSGELRGVNNLDISFNYPITAIAGKNGAGKSTILALACCGFHNTRHGFKLPKRKTYYYTFSDFFIQHKEEVSPEGIEVRYGIAHNNWKKTVHLPDGIGIGYQSRKKKKGGRWNDYADRVRRNVVFLGIERIVPHSERSQSKSYSRSFKEAEPKGWEDKVKDIVGYILGRTYDEFRYLEYSKYSLPIVQTGGAIYSGFNMGAGENALFEIFSTLYSCGDGALLVMDEVELGLHSGAQRKFIEKLKDVCLENHSQVICTTHSKEIFDCLPNDARYFIECVNGKTKIIDSISSSYAFSKLGAIEAKELDIYVEDEVAKSLILAALDTNLRSRVNIRIIGSATAISKQLAALYVRGERHPVLAVFDGDQTPKEDDNIGHAKKMAENVNEDFDDWFRSHIAYLPGDTWPESWLVQKNTEHTESLAILTGTEVDYLADILEYALQAGKHNEFYEISKNIGLEKSLCLHLLTSNLLSNHAEVFTEISDKVLSVIEENG